MLGNSGDGGGGDWMRYFLLAYILPSIEESGQFWVLLTDHKFIGNLILILKDSIHWFPGVFIFWVVLPLYEELNVLLVQIVRDYSVASNVLYEVGLFCYV